jgi:hypothetical protein
MASIEVYFIDSRRVASHRATHLTRAPTAREGKIFIQFSNFRQGTSFKKEKKKRKKKGRK